MKRYVWIAGTAVLAVLALGGCSGLLSAGGGSDAAVDLAMVAAGASDYRNDQVLAAMGDLEKQDLQDSSSSSRSLVETPVIRTLPDGTQVTIEKSWDEISFIKIGETEVERMNRTYLYEKDKVKRMLILMRERLQKMYEYKYPIQRRVMEERLNFLESEFNKFDYMINPYHIQPGLLLDVDITSIKRKKATLDGMANVLNEFLHGVSKGFQDAAFASFSRRRSTVRQDIAQSFATSPEEEDTGNDYLDMLNEPSGSNTGTTKTGVVDVTPKKGRSRSKKKQDDGGLKEI